MPIITINLLEGRTDAQKEQLIHKVTEACHTALGAPRESVRIIISDMLKPVSYTHLRAHETS